jgi:hypothetical protein
VAIYVDDGGKVFGHLPEDGRFYGPHAPTGRFVDHASRIWWELAPVARADHMLAPGSGPVTFPELVAGAEKAVAVAQRARIALSLPRGKTRHEQLLASLAEVGTDELVAPADEQRFDYNVAPRLFAALGEDNDLDGVLQVLGDHRAVYPTTAYDLVYRGFLDPSKPDADRLRFVSHIDLDRDQLKAFAKSDPSPAVRAVMAQRLSVMAKKDRRG